MNLPELFEQPSKIVKIFAQNPTEIRTIVKTMTEDEEIKESFRNLVEQITIKTQKRLDEEANIIDV